MKKEIEKDIEFLDLLQIGMFIHISQNEFKVFKFDKEKPTRDLIEILEAFELVKINHSNDKPMFSLYLTDKGKKVKEKLIETFINHKI